MTQQIILIIIAVLIVAVLVSRRGREKVMSVYHAAFSALVKKGANKEEIIILLEKQGNLGNRAIREALGISDRTVVRYMDELEADGRVEQVGITGRDVEYRLKR